MPQVTYWRTAFLSLIVCCIFFLQLGGARLWDRDEPRNARASHEMLARGDWIVPTFNGQLRDHKPILLYWGQMLSYLSLGESEFTARLPSALCAILTIFSVAVLASRLSGTPRGISTEGFWAAGCLATCGLFVMAGRAATPDACLIAFSTLGMAALVISALAPAHPFSSGHVRKARWLPAMFGYTMLGLAALAKGPVGVVLPLTIVHLWWIICFSYQQADRAGGQPREAEGNAIKKSTWSEDLRWLVWSLVNPAQWLRAVMALKTVPGLLLTLLAAAPWYVAVGIETNGEFLRGFFLNHNLGRALDSMEGHHGSILYYPIAFLVGTFPWSLWLAAVVVWGRQATRDNPVQRQLAVLSAVWIAVYLGAFSLASTKLPSYITPCYAGAALALGSFWQQFETGWSRPPQAWRHIACGLAIILGTGLAAGIVWYSQRVSMPLLAWAAGGGVSIAATGVLGFWWERQQRPQRLPLAWLTSAAIFQLFLFAAGTTSVDAYRQDLGALRAAARGETLQSAKQHLAPNALGTVETGWIAVGGMEPSWVHYLDNEIYEVTSSAAVQSTWDEVEYYVQQHPDVRLIVVGDEAQAAFRAWSQADPRRSFIEVARAPRFLRHGAIQIFAPQGLEARPVEKLGNQRDTELNLR